MKLPKLLLYLFAGAVVLLLIAEVVVRLVAPQPLNPGTRFIFENDVEGMAREVEYSIDSNNIRWWRSGGGAAELTILCAGGMASTTMFQNAGDTWWGQLGQGLERELGKRIAIGVVAGVRDPGIHEGSQWVDHLLAQVEGVDLVIAMYGHFEVLSPKVDEVFDPGSIPAPAFEGTGFKYGIAKASHLARVVRNGRKKSQRNDRQREYGRLNFLRESIVAARSAYLATEPITRGPEREGDPQVGFLHGVQSLIDITKKHGAKLLVVGEPTIFFEFISPDATGALHTTVHIGPGDRDYAKPEPAWVEAELERCYAAASRLCADTGTAFFDLQGVVLQTRENFFTEAFLTDAGAARAGEELLPSAAQLLE